MVPVQRGRGETTTLLPPRTYRIWVATALTAGGTFLVKFESGSFAIAIVSMCRDMQVPLHVGQWVILGPLLSAISLTPVVSLLSTRSVPKDIYCLGLFFLGLSTLLGYYAPTIEWVIVSRLLQGMVFSLLDPLSTSIACGLVHRAEQGRVVSSNRVFTLLGKLLGPSLGGICTYHLGWRSTFSMNLPIILVALLVGIIGLPRTEPEKVSTSVNPLGAISAGVSVGLFVAVCTLGSLWMIVVAGCLGVLWLRYSPLGFLPLELGSNCRFLHQLYLAGTYSFVGILSGYALDMYLQRVKHLDPETVSLLQITSSLSVLGISGLHTSITKVSSLRLGGFLLIFGTLGLFLFTSTFTFTDHLPYLIVCSWLQQCGLFLTGLRNTTDLIEQFGVDYGLHFLLGLRVFVGVTMRALGVVLCTELWDVLGYHWIVGIFFGCTLCACGTQLHRHEFPETPSDVP